MGRKRWLGRGWVFVRGAGGGRNGVSGVPETETEFRPEPAPSGCEAVARQMRGARAQVDPEFRRLLSRAGGAAGAGAGKQERRRVGAAPVART